VRWLVIERTPGLTVIAKGSCVGEIFCCYIYTYLTLVSTIIISVTATARATMVLVISCLFMGDNQQDGGLADTRVSLVLKESACT
jgi:hypothetical protein